MKYIVTMNWALVYSNCPNLTWYEKIGRILCNSTNCKFLKLKTKKAYKDKLNRFGEPKLDRKGNVKKKFIGTNIDIFVEGTLGQLILLQYSLYIQLITHQNFSGERVVPSLSTISKLVKSSIDKLAIKDILQKTPSNMTVNRPYK